MSDSPSVSLVIVNQDRKEELAGLVSALRFQRLMPSEIIVVTNLPDADRPTSPLEIIYLPSPEAGISAARNVGIAAASGEIIAFCDDDAVPEFCWLEHLVEPLTLRGVAACGGYVRGRNGVSFQSRTTLVDRWGRDWPQRGMPHDTWVYPPEKDSVPKTMGTNCAFKRADLVSIGGFDESYRFFMDESDVNLRLSDAGFQTAIAPLAEVHHGYAASRRRTSRRVPCDLYEIGASKAHFCQSFAGVANIEKLMPEFIEEQKERLSRFYHIGLLNSRRAETLMKGLMDGIADGQTRKRKLPTLDATKGEVPRAEKVERPRALIRTRLAKLKAAEAKASEMAKAGYETTVIQIEYTARPLRVWWDERGFWVHRIGIFGRDNRSGKARPGWPETRFQRELKRIEVMRGLSASGTEVFEIH
jgi:GT2 family glycosyltransferase